MNLKQKIYNFKIFKYMRNDNQCMIVFNKQINMFAILLQITRQN